MGRGAGIGWSTRAPGRLWSSLGTTAVCAVVAASAVAAGARWRDSVDGPVAEGGWTQRSRAAFVASGFYPAELDGASGRYFSWSRQTARLELPALGRSRATAVRVAVRGLRPAYVPAASVQVLVDDRVVAVTTVPAEPSELAFEIPRAQRTGATVILETSPLYQPGGSDPRALGIVVDDVRLAPVNGSFVPVLPVLLLVGFGAALAALGLRLCGLTGLLGGLASVAVAAGFAWLALQDAAFLGWYAQRLVSIGGAVCVLGALVWVLRRRWPVLGGAPGWSAAAGLMLAAGAVKLAVFWHPLAIVGDGLFQVHRAAVVHRGEFFFTSVTPQPFFEFPYPIALYVAAQPFWAWFPGELDLLRLLRALTIGADALVGVAIYLMVMRLGRGRAAALIATALWPLARAPLQALANANLTNLFGQSLFAVALAGAACLAGGSSAGAVGLAAIAAFLVAAFLSHFGTVTVGVAMFGAAGVALLLVGRGFARRAGAWMMAVLLLAASVSWVAYYSHFTDVYARTWADVSARGSDDSSKLVASPSVKLGRWWAGTGDDYGRPGVPVLLAAVAGAALVVRRQRRTGAGLVLLAWVLAWVALSVLGILTPFTLRANLAVAPALVALCGVALGSLADHSRAGAVAAAVLALVLAWDGGSVAIWAITLAGR